MSLLRPDKITDPASFYQYMWWIDQTSGEGTPYNFYAAGVYGQFIYVIPIHLSKEHKNMLAHCKQMLEYNSGTVAIHPKFNKLITALRTAVENGEGVLDKEATSHDDLFESFRLSLSFWY